MSTIALPMMTNYQPQFNAVSALRNRPAGDLHDLRKTLLAVIGAGSIAFASALSGTASPVGGANQTASAAGINSAGAYHIADVLEPGTRGSVVDI
jgi:hypothetical protein